jgi:putative MATE family efflux protein
LSEGKGQGREPETPKFLQGNLMRHVSVMSFTAGIGLLAIFAVDLIDMVFIAMLGNDALAAAVGYAGSILFFTSSISIGLSIAAGALTARALGAGEPDKASEMATSVLIVGVLLAAITVGVIWFSMPSLLTALGATGETHALAMQYLRIIVPSMPLLMAAMVGSAVLRAHGDARRAMWATLIGGIVNAVLDPILIFGLDWGLEGAAAASVVARFSIFLAAIIPAVKHYRGFSGWRNRLLRRDFPAVAQIAGPAILTNIATPFGAAFVTRQVAQFGTDAVAGMAIIGRLTPVAFAALFALSGAIGPIIGQNFGAQNHARVRTAFRAGLLFALIYVLVVSLILYGLRLPIAQLFNAQGETLALVMLFCGPLALAYFFNGAIFVGNAAFNNLGQPITSTWINWGRHTVGTIPFALVGASLGGAAGVLIGQALGGVLFAVVSIWLASRVMSTKDPKDRSHHPFREHLQSHFWESRKH